MLKDIVACDSLTRVYYSSFKRIFDRKENFYSIYKIVYKKGQILTAVGQFRSKARHPCLSLFVRERNYDYNVK